MERKRSSSRKGRKSSGDRKRKTSRGKSPRHSSRKRKEHLNFPIGEIHNLFCGDDPIEKVETQAAILVIASETYVATEILECALNHAISRGSDEVTNTDIIEVIQADEELKGLLGDCIENEANKMKEEQEAKERKAKEAKEKKANDVEEKKKRRKKSGKKTRQSEETE